MAQWKSLRQKSGSTYTEFSGGINTANTTLEVSDNETIDEYGIDTDAIPAIHTFKGRAAYGSAGDGSTNLLTNYGTTELVRVVGTVMQHDSGSGSWEDITSGLTDTDWSATNFNGKLILTNGTDNVKYWDGSTLSDLPGSAPKGKHVASNSIRAFLANTYENPDWVYYSKYLDETNWTDTDSAGFFQYYTANGGPITALREFQGVVLAFKKDAMAEIIGTGQTSQKHRLVDISNSIGCVSYKTIAEVATPQGSVLFFLGQNNVYMFSSGQPVPVGEKLRGILSRLNSSQINLCWGGTDGIRYFLGLVTDENTQPDTLCMYDPRRGHWRIVRIHDNLRFSAMLNNVWYAGDANGQTYKMQQGWTVDGSPVSWMVTSKDYSENAPELEKEYWELHIQLYAPTGTTFTVEVSTDQGTTWTQVGDPITTQSINQNVPVIVPLDTIPISNWARFRLQGTGEVVIHGMKRFFRVHPMQY